ncbi:MAG: DNA-3-methyladenine glycosylase I [Phycisphaerae bacterium]|nr:DNA-3-methyladenine glycosylase I [Phycisphaerae bacterium]
MTESTRCSWCGSDPLYVAYHDEEWGVPVTDDQSLFEKLVLDGFQAGLSWITILKKRDAFRAAFKNFDPHKVARFRESDVDKLLTNAGIIRSRLKINATIKNARLWLGIMEQGDGAFRDFLWQHVEHRTAFNSRKNLQDIPAATDASTAMAKALKRAGFSFCGPTICYAFMQAVGMVNDHVITCPRHKACAKLARR